MKWFYKLQNLCIRALLYFFVFGLGAAQAVQDTFYLDTYLDDSDKPDEQKYRFISAKSNIVMPNYYVCSITIKGTVSLWFDYLYDNLCNGAFLPENTQYNSPGFNGRAGIDAEYAFAVPQSSSDFCPGNFPSLLEDNPNKDQGFKFNTTDVNNGWFWANHKSGTFNLNHIYHYTEIGQGHKLQVRFYDVPVRDNHGKFKIEMRCSPYNPPYKRFKGITHSPLGQAQLSINSDRLIVSNIGSTSEDGVGITLDNAKRFALTLEPFEFRNLNAAFILKTTGTFNGEPDVFLGEASFTNIHGNLQVKADYTSIGADLVLVKILNNGRLVGQTTMPAGIVGNIINDTARIKGCKKILDEALPPCYICEFDDEIVYSSNDSELKGNEIQLLAANATGVVTSLSSFSLQAANVNSFVITNETLLVKLNSFIAQANGKKILIKWQTASEINNAGFNLWRARPHPGTTCQDTKLDEYWDVTRVTSEPSKDGNTVEGNSYSYEDITVKPGLTYCYALEDINFEGKSTFHLNDIVSAIVNNKY